MRAEAERKMGSPTPLKSGALGPANHQGRLIKFKRDQCLEPLPEICNCFGEEPVPRSPALGTAQTQLPRKPESLVVNAHWIYNQFSSPGWVDICSTNIQSCLPEILSQSSRALPA